MRNRFFKSLYWKLSAVFLLVLTIVGAAYAWLTFFSTEMYFFETSQRLNASVAQHIVNDVQPFIDGKPNTEEMNKIFHSVMVVNPSVEVYLLDSTGKILTFDAPKEKVKLTSVSLSPIQEFLQSDDKKLVLGENPRDVHKQKVFSAAPVVMNGMIYGYIYVILGGEQFDSIAERIRASNILSLGLRGFLLSLIGAGVVGLVALAFVTRKLRRMRQSVMAFKEGDYSQRVAIKSNDELDDLGASFNDMASTIQKNLEELNRADALRRELIANISHDLRTPLASIQGYVETLMMKEDSLNAEEKQQFLKTIFSSAERLGRLVQELFELSKLEAKQSQPKIEVFSMPELVNDVTMKFAPHAERNGVTISAEIPKSLPLVAADIGMIERVLQNLVENALNHTPSGGRVNVALARRDRKVVVAVEDTGVGVAEKDLPFIFERFYSARSRTQVNNSGAGLGLAITKKILEAHHEKIQVQSRVNEGTRFTFELPAANQR